MTPEEAKHLIDNDNNFIYSKRYGYSAKELIIKHPDGCSNRLIASVMMMTEPEVEELYESIVLKLREHMQVNLEDI